jgi:hypothetical protein
VSKKTRSSVVKRSWRRAKSASSIRSFVVHADDGVLVFPAFRRDVPQHVGDPAAFPQPLEDERAPNASGLAVQALAALTRAEHKQPLREAAEAGDDRIQPAGLAQLVDAPEALEHAPGHLAVNALVFDEEEVDATVDGVGAQNRRISSRSAAHVASRV